MKAFGYLATQQEAKSPTNLKEMTLCLTLDEIDVLISFLQDVKKRFHAGSPIPGQSHCHLQDWWNEWESPDPDLVIVYDE